MGVPLTSFMESCPLAGRLRQQALTSAAGPPRAGIMDLMSAPKSRRFPVTVTRLPVVRCGICRRTVAYRPGTASEALTGHYSREHPDELGQAVPASRGTAPPRVG